MNNKEKLEIPDYVYDMHTRKGRKMGRSLKHFYEEGAYINRPNKLDGEEEMELLAMNIDMLNSNSQKIEENVYQPEYKEGTLF